MIGSLAVARGAAKGNPAVSEQVLQATRRLVDELMRAPARTSVTS
jgi:TetR/AcrR family transcriptional repressor of nem operon